MSLSATVVSAVNSARTALGDLVRDGVLRKQTKTSYTPGTAIAFTPVDTPISFAVTQYSSQEKQDSLIRALDVKLIVFPASAIPETNDLIIAGTASYHIVNVRTVYAGSEIVLHVIQARPG